MKINDMEQLSALLDQHLAARHVWNVDFTDIKFYFGKFLDNAIRQAHDVYLSNNPIADGDFSRKSWGSEFNELYYFRPQINSFGKFTRLLKAAGEAAEDSKNVDVYVKMLAVVAAFEYAYITFEPLARKLNDLKSYIQKGRKPSEEISDADRRTIEDTGTCAVCGRNIKLEGGVMYAHGFKISHGFRNGRCPGVGFKPIEVSPEGARAYLAALRAHKLSLEVTLERNPHAEFFYREVRQAGWMLKEMVKVLRGEPGFDRLQEQDAQRLESQIRYVVADIKLFDEIVKNWKPRPLPDGKAEHLK